MCQFRVCFCLLGRCTRSVGNAPLLFGCSAPYRVHRHVTGAVPHIGCSAPYRVQCPRACGGCRGCGGLLGLGCLLLGLSSAWGTSWCLCGTSCCGSSEMSHVIPLHVFQTLKSHRWNCNVLGRCTKFGYPNYVRVLVDEAPKANSCVRSSSHDTVHDPRDASTWRARLRMERLTVPPVGPNRAWRGCGAARRTQLRMEGSTVPPVGPNRAWRERHPQGPAARLRAGRAHKQGKM